MFAATVITLAATETVPFIGWFTTNWDKVGGWSLFIGLCVFIVAGAVFEWWVPGRRYRRLEVSSDAQSKTLANTVELLKDQTQANEITKHFFEKTVPKRGEPQE